ncbi:hypothetical protein GJAV_G00208480 [Gymnothorax javanicus]|nr:hypothetical protein GJAV_G00208480 [Gymnothorax javanicus]
MVLEELCARLNDIGYKNWLKAGYCLLKLRDGLHVYVNNEMKSFHSRLINYNPVLRMGHRCNLYCRPKGNELYHLCELCEEWRAEILRHHTSKTAVVNWGNCKPFLWSSDHWELAKAYMPRGLSHITGAEQCDASSLLNLIIFCDYFSFINQGPVRQVIRKRNELMHSSEMRVSAQWMEQYQGSLDQLVQQLQHVPAVARAGQEIREMLSADWTVFVPGVVAVDGPESVGLEAGDISEVEIELLRERLQDLLQSEEPQDPPDLQAMHELQKLKDFLCGHRDLEEKFQTELSRIKEWESQLEQTTTGWGESAEVKTAN